MVVLSPDQRKDNADEQMNETELLVSMFDSDVVIEENNVITVNIKSKHFLLVLRCLYHEHYPSHDPPIFAIMDMTNTLHASHAIDDMLLEAECSKLFTPGECVIYSWVMYIQEYLESLDVFISENAVSPPLEEVENEKVIADLENLQILEDQFNAEGAAYVLEVVESSSEELPSPEIYTGRILTERKSHFQAHICKVFSKEDVHNAMKTLLRNPKIAGASHNIMAYRFTSESGTINQDYDDDGETKAGGRLLELISLMNVENLMVVVSRWYGGVLLGPSRFKCINNIAKETIVESGFHNSQAHGNKKKNKKK